MKKWGGANARKVVHELRTDSRMEVGGPQHVSLPYFGKTCFKKGETGKKPIFIQPPEASEGYTTYEHKADIAEKKEEFEIAMEMFKDELLVEKFIKEYKDRQNDNEPENKQER